MIFNTKIRKDETFSEVATNAQDIFSFNSMSQGAEDCLELSNEILNKNTESSLKEEIGEKRATFIVNTELIEK